MPRPAPDPDLVRAAHDLSRAGASNPEIGETLGVTEGAIRAWLKRPRPDAPIGAESVPAHMAPTRPRVPVDVTPLDVSDQKAMVEQLLRDMHGMVQGARASGNMAGAASMAATAGRLALLLKQVSENEAGDANVFSCSISELNTAEAMIESRLQALADRGPVRCAACARELSVAWGTGDL